MLHQPHQNGTSWTNTIWSTIAAKIISKLSNTIYHRTYALIHKIDYARGTYGLVIARPNVPAPASNERLHLFVELHENDGMSVTNAIEILVLKATEAYGKPAWNAEHYEGDLPDRVDQVLLKDGHPPHWKPIFPRSK